MPPFFFTQLVREGLVEVTQPKLAPWPRDAKWHEAVNAPLETAKLDLLRRSVVRGTPFGLPEWVGQLVADAGMESTLRPRARWNQRQRHQAFEWISCHAKAILRTRMKSDQRSVHAARRHAVEAWLSDQALIEVH